MICNYCGMQLPDGSTFCPNCGTPTAAQPQAYPQEPQQAYSQQGWSPEPQQAYSQQAWSPEPQQAYSQQGWSPEPQPAYYPPQEQDFDPNQQSSFYAEMPDQAVYYEANEGAPERQEYIAFLSYRHLELDKKAAKLLQSRIERYVIPKELRRFPGEKKLGNVFRDEDELPLSPNLSDSIIYALDHSEYLIVVCSPELPKSQWCEAEIRYFLQSHSRDHVLAVLIDGDPASSFSPLLLYTYDETGNITGYVEPMAANIAGKKHAINRKSLGKEMTRIFSALLGCSFDTLWQRERRRRVSVLLASLGAAACLLAVFLSVVLNFALQTKNANEQLNVVNERLADANTQLVSALSTSNTDQASTVSYYGNSDQALAYYAKALEIDPQNRNAKAGALFELQSKGWLVYDPTSETIPEPADPEPEYEVEVGDSLIRVRVSDGWTYEVPRPTMLSDSLVEGDRVNDVPDAAYMIDEDRVYILVSYGGYLNIYTHSLPTPQSQASTVRCSFHAMIDCAEYLHKENKYYCAYTYTDPEYIMHYYQYGLAALWYGDQSNDHTIGIVDIREGKYLTDVLDFFLNDGIAFSPDRHSFAIIGTNSSDWGDNGDSAAFYNIGGRCYGKIERNTQHWIVSFGFDSDGSRFLWADPSLLKLFNGETILLAAAPLHFEQMIKSASFTEDGSITVASNDSCAKYHILQFVSAENADGPMADPGGAYSFRFTEDCEHLETIDADGNVISSVLLPVPVEDTTVKYHYHTAEENGNIYYHTFSNFVIHIHADPEGNLSEPETIVVPNLLPDEGGVLAVAAYPGGFAVSLTGRTVLVYKTGETVPYRTIDVGCGYIAEIAINSNGLLAVEGYSTTGYTAVDFLELWDYENNKRIGHIEGDHYDDLSLSESGVLTFSNYDYHTEEWGTMEWVLSGPDADEALIEALASLTSCTLNDDATLGTQTPVFTGNLGAWSSLLSAETPYE